MSTSSRNRLSEYMMSSRPIGTKINSRIGDYILGLFNQKVGSDFIFECNGDKTYLHKWILRRNPYFQTLFDTPIGHTSEEIIEQQNIIFDPEEYQAAIILAKSIYCDKFSKKEMIARNIELLTCISLAKEWMIDGLIWIKLIKILSNNWSKLVASEIYNAEIIYLLTDDSLLDYLSLWINKNVTSLPQNARQWSLFKQLRPNNVLLFHYMYEQFNQIHNQEHRLDSLPEVMQHCPKITLKTFSPNVISYVFRSKICGWRNNTKIDHRHLRIERLLPFTAEYFGKVATLISCHKIEDECDKENWLLLQVEEDFSREDILLIGDMPINKVILRDLNLKPVVDKVYSHLQYYLQSEFLYPVGTPLFKMVSVT